MYEVRVGSGCCCETRVPGLLSLEEIAEAMIAGSDHSDICGRDHVIYDNRPASRETCCVCRYHVCVNATTGALWTVGDDPIDRVTFAVDAAIDEEVLAVLDGPDDGDEEADGLLGQMIDEARVEDFLDCFDLWEGLHSPGFRRAAEELLDQMTDYFA